MGWYADFDSGSQWCLAPVGSAIIVAAAAKDPSALDIHLESSRWHRPVAGDPSVLGAGPFPVARDPHGVWSGLGDDDFRRRSVRWVGGDGR